MFRRDLKEILVDITGQVEGEVRKAGMEGRSLRRLRAAHDSGRDHQRERRPVGQAGYRDDAPQERSRFSSLRAHGGEFAGPRQVKPGGRLDHHPDRGRPARPRHMAGDFFLRVRRPPPPPLLCAAPPLIKQY